MARVNSRVIEDENELEAPTVHPHLVEYLERQFARDRLDLNYEGGLDGSLTLSHSMAMQSGREDVINFLRGLTERNS